MRYCLIGEKLSHSYSSEIHNGLNLNYSLTEVSKENFNAFFENGSEYDGFNVTIPYKKDVMKFLDGVDDLAQRIGAVNTVKKVDGKLYGFNTDYFGLKFTVDSLGANVMGKNVAILGSGGAKNTAETLCKDLGAKQIYIVSRKGEINYSNVYDLDIDIIINTTPVGMFPNNGQMPIDLRRVKGVSVVIDCIYNPIKTALILQAEKLGIKCAGGLLMLVSQALKAQEIWLDKKFTNEQILSEYDKLLKEKRNVVLIGMPSSGKSTLARLLAESKNKEFIDTDDEIYKRTHHTPAEIITTLGERAFRDIESEVCYNVGKNSGKIIATGGGSILREENRNNLKQNAYIVYVMRDLDKLVDDDRPLSQKDGFKRLYEERKEIYESFSDLMVINNKTVEDALKELENL